MTRRAAPAPASAAWSLWIVVFTGPALRTSLLGALLVAEASIGEKFGLQGSDLALLIECSIFGALLSVLLLPSMIERAGVRMISIGATLAATLLLAAGMVLVHDAPSGSVAIAALFVGIGLLGFLVSVPSPVTQKLLNTATTDNAVARHNLQSVWSAGMPIGFIAASLFGGIAVEIVGWWAAFVVPLVLAAVSALAFCDRNLLLAGAEGGAHDSSFREVGILILALIAFEIWSTSGSLDSWFAPSVLILLLLTIGTTALAVARLRVSKNPTISLEPYSVGGFAAATAIMLLYQFPTTAEFEVLLLTELDKVSSEAIGNRTAIGNAGQVAGTIIAAGLLYQHRIGLALLTGFVLSIVGLASYTLYPWVHDFLYISATRTITGLGGGLLTPVLFVIALHRMPVPLQLAAGTWLVLANIGGVELGLALFDMVLETAGHVTGSKLTAYVTVEVGQLAVGVATAVLAGVLVARGRLPITFEPSSGRRSDSL